jgi:1-acyl-sn-glycerol-3-phosphate acyltransferase
MDKILRLLFVLLIVKPIVLLVIGLRVVYKERLPKSGPAIIIANHNSHLDTAAIAALFPLRLLPKLRPVAAADYFLNNPLLAWFSLNIIGIIPLTRRKLGKHQDPLASCSQALENNDILIIYPEGSRGEPECLTEFKCGIAHLAKRHPQVPIYPIFLHGLGKALPRGEALLVPFFCDVLIGNSLKWNGSKINFMTSIEQEIHDLAASGNFPKWD